MGFVGSLVTGLVLVPWLAEDRGTDQAHPAIAKIGQADGRNPILIRLLAASRQMHRPPANGVVGQIEMGVDDPHQSLIASRCRTTLRPSAPRSYPPSKALMILPRQCALATSTSIRVIVSKA